MLGEFGESFPATRAFSRFAQQTLPGVSPRDDPDAALVAWMEREEELFRAFERHLVSRRLETGFGNDVDEFISYSLSVQNRRKSRAGLALEHHLENIFSENGIGYSRGRETENRAKPDFVFPGIAEYHEQGFSSDALTMLGVKTTCKDRWRQVLSEAERIRDKHLLTLEPGISENQTNEMRANHLQLVVPRELLPTFTAGQRGELMDLRSFVDLVKERQTKTGTGLLI
jgi:hypothetical protein